MDIIDLLLIASGIIVGCVIGKVRHLDILNEKEDIISDLNYKIQSISSKKDYYETEYKRYKEKIEIINIKEQSKLRVIENDARNSVKKIVFDNNDDAYYYYRQNGGTNDLNTFLLWYIIASDTDSSKTTDTTSSNNYDDDTKSSYNSSSSSSYDSGSSYSSDSSSSSSSY